MTERTIYDRTIGQDGFRTVRVTAKADTLLIDADAVLEIQRKAEAHLQHTYWGEAHMRYAKQAWTITEGLDGAFYAYPKEPSHDA